jgi:hypothetical protein
MDDLQKLKHLIGHWKEHNEEHANTYLEWSKKMEAAGKGELAAVLRELADDTELLGKLFEKAGGLLN